MIVHTYRTNLTWHALELALCLSWFHTSKRNRTCVMGHQLSKGTVYREGCQTTFWNRSSPYSFYKKLTSGSVRTLIQAKKKYLESSIAFLSVAIHCVLYKKAITFLKVVYWDHQAYWNIGLSYIKQTMSGSCWIDVGPGQFDIIFYTFPETLDRSTSSSEKKKAKEGKWCCLLVF